MYRSKLQAIQNPTPGEINEEPSMTVQGEYKEMKEIMRDAMAGMQVQTSDVQYFKPESITQINSLFRNSLDLTDLDALRAKTKQLTKEVDEAYKTKKRIENEKKELEEQRKKENEQAGSPGPETSETETD